MAISDELFQLSQESMSQSTSPARNQQSNKDWSGTENGILYRVQTNVPVDPNMWSVITTRYNQAIEDHNDKQTGGKKDKLLPFRTEGELHNRWFKVCVCC
jgi:hypothetical protein